MKCREVNELLVAYLDNEVTPSERTLIQAHLAECDFCRKKLAALSATQGRVSQSLQMRAAQAAPSPQAWNRLHARLAGEARPSSSWVQRLAPSVWQVVQVNPLAMKGEMKMSRKAVLIAVALVALVSVAFFAYPPTHTLALEVLARFESMIITNAPTVSERSQDPTPVGQPTATPIVVPLPILTVKEANEQAGFEILYPQYVPVGYQLVARRVHHAEAGVNVGTTYAMEGGIPSISFSQTRYDPELAGEYRVGDAPTINVEVRGQPGLWVEQAAVGLAGGEPWLRNLLIWQEGDIFITLGSDDLPLQEMSRIAESLSP